MNSIQTFAQISPTEFGAILAILIGMLTGFYALLKFVLGQHATILEADRAERVKLAEAITKMADPEINGNKAIADGITRQADESAARNGHLAELELKSQKMFKTLADRNYAAITNIKVQKVANQVVEHEQVNKKE
jgi:hypothetical protein